jgi:Site-specific recombinases, DNA invertase Pin homologs
MRRLCVAWYARVSSEQQAEKETIASQIAELEKRIQEDGFSVSNELRFIDDGYSGATLVRPGLERLRDTIATGLIDRLYIHSPDRLSRKYAYQVLLIEEFQRVDVEVVFLNQEIGKTPEEHWLLQVQGVISEYERAKIIERNRRGKRHAAQRGLVNVLANAPYGYRYIDKYEGGGQAQYEIDPEEAPVVQQVFSWIGRDRVGIGEVARRLHTQAIPTRTGKAFGDRTTIWGMLKNPAYKGKAAFGKTKTGVMRPRLRAHRHAFEPPKKACSSYARPREDWIEIEVPVLIDEALFEAVQEQLKDNRKHARQRARGARYLLQGLVMCRGCGYAYYGKLVSLRAAKAKHRDYAYYRCIGSDGYRFGGYPVCDNKQVRTDLLEKIVWSEVKNILQDPKNLESEYRHRLENLEMAPARQPSEPLERQLAKLRQGVSRLIDSYAEGIIDKSAFEPKVKRLKGRMQDLEQKIGSLAQVNSTKKALATGHRPP